MLSSVIIFSIKPKVLKTKFYHHIGLILFNSPVHKFYLNISSILLSCFVASSVLLVLIIRILGEWQRKSTGSFLKFIFKKGEGMGGGEGEEKHFLHPSSEITGNHQDK